MDATAIKEIGRLAIEAAEANKLDTPTPSIVVGGKVESLEHLHDGRSRFRGKLATPSLADFVGYVKRDHGLSANFKPAVFIDAAKLSANAFFNLGDHQDPGHADHAAVLALDPTAAYKAVRKIDGAKLGQKGLAEFIDEWQLQLTAFDEKGDVLSIRQAAGAVRSVKIKADRETSTTVRNFGATKSALEEIEAKAAGLDALPARLQFDFTPALGLPQRTADLRVTIVVDGDEPLFAAKWFAREQVEEAIAQDFKRVLFEELGDAAHLTIGTFTP